MAIRFSCPDCAQLVEVADDAAGMQVRCGNCHSTVRAPADPPASSRRSGPANEPPSDFPRPLRRIDNPSGTLTRWLPLGLSGLALVVAVIALCVVSLRDPHGSGLKKYDFKTPRAALESRARMEANGDVRALLELKTGIGSEKAKERANTLKVHKEISHQRYKLLFVSYQEKGNPRNTVEVFEKDVEAESWKPAHVDAHELARDNEVLRDQIQDWERFGGGRFPDFERKE